LTSAVQLPLPLRRKTCFAATSTSWSSTTAPWAPTRSGPWRGA